MRRPFLFCLTAFSFVTFILVFFSSYINISQRIMPTTDSNQRHLANETAVRNDTGADKKIVLLWTSFFGENDYLKFPSEFQCIETRCTFSSDRSLLDRSQVVVFHFPDMNYEDLPPFRTPEQVWVWHVLESPLNSRVDSRLNGLMNWTATYRRDSDIWTPYGSFHRRRTEIVESNNNHSANKTKMAVWFVSNCNTESNREGYVNIMKELIPVDIYGLCGDKHCLPKMSPECYRMAEESYRFYLAFENSYCRDYVTEKFFHILNTGMVPVVFGGIESSLAPEGSYIDSSKFKGPRELATYLLKVAANDTLYNSYFDWKKYYAQGGYHWSCEICNKLHQGHINQSVYDRLDTWWHEPGICKRWDGEKLVNVERFDNL